MIHRRDMLFIVCTSVGTFGRPQQGLRDRFVLPMPVHIDRFFKVEIW